MSPSCKRSTERSVYMGDLSWLYHEEIAYTSSHSVDTRFVLVTGILVPEICYRSDTR